MHRSPICFSALAGNEYAKTNAVKKVTRVVLTDIVVPLLCCNKKRCCVAQLVVDDRSVE